MQDGTFLGRLLESAEYDRKAESLRGTSRYVVPVKPRRVATQVFQSDAVRAQSPESRAALRAGHDPRSMSTRSYEAARIESNYNELAYDMRRNKRDKVKVR